MAGRRLVGIDLGIASAHTVRVIDETGETVAKRKCYPTVVHPGFPGDSVPWIPGSLVVWSCAA